MKQRVLAYAKKNEIENGYYPTASIYIRRQEWETLKFLYMQLDESDDTDFIPNDHPEGFNVILMHPVTKELFWSYSHDLDFTCEEESPKLKRFKVINTETRQWLEYFNAIDVLDANDQANNYNWRDCSASQEIGGLYDSCTFEIKEVSE